MSILFNLSFPLPPQVNDFLSRHSLDQDILSPAPKRRKDSMCVINDSEESQLATAIAASIQETSAACPKGPILVLSDSDDNSDLDDSDSQAMDESDATDHHLTSQHHTDKHRCGSAEAVVIPFPHSTAGADMSEPLGRQDSAKDGVRALRNELQTLKVEEKQLARRQMSKSGTSNPTKGKSKAGRGWPSFSRGEAKVINVDEEEVEEVVSSSATGASSHTGTSNEDGPMEGVDLSQLLLRLPDGSRLEKSFPADHPIEVCLDSHHQQNGACILCLLSSIPLKS